MEPDVANPHPPTFDRHEDTKQRRLTYRLICKASFSTEEYLSVGTQLFGYGLGHSDQVNHRNAPCVRHLRIILFSLLLFFSARNLPSAV
jgi:hypothetical protein